MTPANSPRASTSARATGCVRSSVEGGYYPIAGKAMPSEEAVICLRMAARDIVDSVEETSVRALAKLQQVLSSRRRVNGLGAVTVPLTLANATTGRERLPNRL
ncbi:hypothetical protein SAMN05216215_104463 [Saccharopolyspora shandongensis]|uniref:Uncharacterized protein n=1 Tax=Saccharopolyspora shandongensis TaxID=418495 RepID=A0A1H3PXX7_9PSEU|nr:hypothetical protein [Saccharopolyspora shandongensis]SDZ05850.1 hypothetical protein SAMN05216215_104463 [Saccharopolyspora shandongensis]